MYIDLANQAITTETTINGKKLNEIYRYENMPKKTGMCIMRGAQGTMPGYDMEILASLSDGQYVVNISKTKLYGK